MLIYLSTRFSRQGEMLAVRQRLEKLGHDCVSRWLDEPSPEEQVGDWQERVAEDDLEDIEGADIFVLFTDGADSPDAWRGGRHVELGFALGRGRSVVLIGPRENVFHHLEQVAVFPDLEAWLAMLEPEEELPEHLSPDYERCREAQ